VPSGWRLLITADLNYVMVHFSCLLSKNMTFQQHSCTDLPIKSRRKRWTGHVVKNKNAYKVCWESQKEEPRRRPGSGRIVLK
jgi:hypothetical protein